MIISIPCIQFNFRESSQLSYAEIVDILDNKKACLYLRVCIGNTTNPSEVRDGRNTGPHPQNPYTAGDAHGRYFMRAN